MVSLNEVDLCHGKVAEWLWRYVWVFISKSVIRKSAGPALLKFRFCFSSRIIYIEVIVQIVGYRAY